MQHYTCVQSIVETITSACTEALVSGPHTVKKCRLMIRMIYENFPRSVKGGSWTRDYKHPAITPLK